MTSELSDEPDPWHREMDRVADAWDDEGQFLPGLARLMERAALWDDEPTHEKRRRGPRWR